MASTYLTAAPEQRVSVPAFTPRIVLPAEWLAAFVDAALQTASVEQVHELVDRVAASKAVSR